MTIHILTFSNPLNIRGATKMDLELLKAAGDNLGFQIEFIFARECQIKLGKKPELIIKNINLDDIKILIVRPNFLVNNFDFKTSLIKQFEISGTPVINGSLAVSRAKNKLKTLQVLSQKKVPIPKTFIVSNSNYIDDVISDLGTFPLILKTLSGSHGNGVSIIESKRGFKSLIEMIVKDATSDPVIVQEYVKESTGKDIRVFIVGRRIIAAMERIATRRGEFRSNFHLGARVRVAELSEEEKHIAFKAVEACGLDVAGVDIIRTNSGPKVLEVNANPGLEGISKATNRDIAGEIIKFAVKKYKRLKNTKVKHIKD
ncbi:MAG: RimK family alpha-L-glutamate ligase [Candidatus Parcubacteria bacterium]|nr:RimK family alpha-L-glutamate ligase [Candidatus Parcubacteria bacterium]